MKNASLPNGKPIDLNQNKLWMKRVMALICVNHPVNPFKQGIPWNQLIPDHAKRTVWTEMFLYCKKPGHC